MINLFITVSKYLMLLLIALYTYCNFRYLAIDNQRARRELCGWQFRTILLIHFLANCIIYIKTMEVKALVFYGIQLIFFLVYRGVFQRLYRNCNRLLLNNTCVLLCYGMIMLERLDFERSARQFIIIVGAALLTLAIPYVIDRVWDLMKWKYLYAGIGIVLLSVVFLIGATSYGAKMSISIAGFSFQASEFVKISFVFFAASMFHQSLSFRNICLTSGIAALHVLVLIACKDLGSALIYFVAYVVMLYIATNRSVYLSLGAGAAALASVVSYKLFSHVRTRVFAWLDPWADIDNRGYQITQSLFAIGTGGFAGLGLYQGMPKRIPIVEKDFIFSAISEEMGGITAICLILICLGCFMQMMMIATYMEFSFYKLLAVGLGIEYILQVFLTVGGAIKFIPSTGVTLPFVSYGGSSMVASFMVFSLIQALFIIQGNEDEMEFGEAPELETDMEEDEEVNEER